VIPVTDNSDSNHSGSAADTTALPRESRSFYEAAWRGRRLTFWSRRKNLCCHRPFRDTRHFFVASKGAELRGHTNQEANDAYFEEIPL
jgi:hypothetical protein